MQVAFVTLALACLAVDNATANGGSKCNTGSVQCCNSVQDARSAAASKILGQLNIPVQSVTGQVGITCTPVTAIGVGSNGCSQQTVCCSKNNYNGVVALGCTPVNVNA
ncbi:fungal hydrophobin [Pholiota conissans]|uniref:Hydrophobin n=1 Tax=Pholiota conissans TaxID=109636 RepID=A0A9P5ZCV7_9AGAR|nr:fungal hydrophobin [Pholiota conissans]